MAASSTVIASLLLLALVATLPATSAAAGTPCVTQSDCPATHYCPSCLLMGGSTSSSTSTTNTNATQSPAVCQPRITVGKTCSLSDACPTCADGLTCLGEPFTYGALLAAPPAARCCAPVQCPACPSGADFVRTVDPLTRCVTSCTCNSASLPTGKLCPANSHWNDCPACKAGCDAKDGLLACPLDCRPSCECNLGFIEKNGLCIHEDECPRLVAAKTTAAAASSTTAAPTAIGGGTLGGGSSSSVNPGGYVTRDVNDPTIRAAARCAMANLNKQPDLMYIQALAKIVSVQSQVVMGVNYKLRLLVGDTACLRFTTRPEACGLSENAALRTYDVLVSVPLGKKTETECIASGWTLVPGPSTTAAPPKTSSAAPVFTDVALPNDQVIQAARCGTYRLSNVLFPNNWFALCRVATAQMQMPVGSTYASSSTPSTSTVPVTYSLGVVLTESSASRYTTDFDSATCPPPPATTTPAAAGQQQQQPPQQQPPQQMGNPPMQKMLVVTYDPVNDDCTLDSYRDATNLPTPDPSITPKPSTASTTPAPTTGAPTSATPFIAGGLVKQDPNAPFIRQAAACGLNQWNLRSNSIFIFALAGIDSASTQVVNGVNYFLRMRIGQSNCMRFKYPNGGASCGLSETAAVSQFDFVVYVPAGSSSCQLVSWTQLRPLSADAPTSTPPSSPSSSAAPTTAAPSYISVADNTPGVVQLAKCGVDQLSVARASLHPFFFVSLVSSEMYRDDTRLVYRFVVDVGPSTCTMERRNESTCLLVKHASLESFQMVVSTLGQPDACTLESSALLPIGGTTTAAPSGSNGGGGSTQWKAAGIVGVCFGVGFFLIALLVVVLRMRRFPHASKGKNSYKGFSNPMYASESTPSNKNTNVDNDIDDDDMDWA